MATFTQANRQLAVTTPLGKDVLLLTAFAGQEALSRLFRFHLDMLSEKDALAAKDIVGKSVTWTYQPAGSTPRYFSGVVSRFTAGIPSGGFRHYRAEVVPWLWLLTHTTDCRIFQNKTAPEIIEQVFRGLGFPAYELSLKAAYARREYCVQYRETDLQFVSRLMEQEGIVYWFRHESAGHTLVLADQKSTYKDCAEKDVAFSVGSLIPNHISRWDHQYEFRAGKFAQTDYHFETPAANLMTNATGLVKLAGNDKLEIYDYPGLYTTKADGDAVTRVRMEEEEAAYDVVTGTSTCRTFTPGGKFTLKKHDCPSEAGKTYVITAIEHSARDTGYTNGRDGGQVYSNSFTCVPDSVTVRPARATPRPVVQGPQTAVVVGPKGEEIYTDKYGRVKVQFHWDREGKKDENSSCWIRVAENWAGKNWGMVFHPRVGQEVIVDFLEGDPDRPIITGRVYNAQQMPPYSLPANQTQSGVKTRSSKGGGADEFNELRFEDAKDKEDIYFHAQKDFHRVVEHDDDLKVGHDQALEIKNNRTEVIKEGDEKVTLEKGQRTHAIKKDDVLKVEGGRTIAVTKDHATTVTQGNYDVHVEQGRVTIQAMDEIHLKVGPNSVVINQQGITLNGMNIKIEGQGMTEVSGAVAKVEAQGVLELKGALTKIG